MSAFQNPYQNYSYSQNNTLSLSSKKHKNRNILDKQQSDDTTPQSAQLSMLSPRFNDAIQGGTNQIMIDQNVDEKDQIKILPMTTSNPLGLGVLSSMLFPNKQSRLSHGFRKSQILQTEENKQQRMLDYQGNHFVSQKAFIFSPPKHGVLRKAKIAKNIFDLAKEDSFDPSPEASSIELFLLRQKQLGPSEVPPPGHYFNAEKHSSFQHKKPSTANIHFNSTQQRIITFGNSATPSTENDEEFRSPVETHAEWKKQRYLSSLNPNNRKLIESQQSLLPSQKSETPFLSNHSCFPKTSSDTFFKRKRSSLSTLRDKQCRTTSFGTSLRTCSFASLNKFPGPGTYAENFEQKCEQKKITAKKPDVFYKSFFGSGTKRFIDLKLIH